MLIQHGKKMTKLCARASGLTCHALVFKALELSMEPLGTLGAPLRYLLPGRCDLATVGRLQLPQPLANRPLRVLIALQFIFNF